jgi:hypothetical protein
VESVVLPDFTAADLMPMRMWFFAVLCITGVGRVPETEPRIGPDAAASIWADSAQIRLARPDDAFGRLHSHQSATGRSA